MYWCRVEGVVPPTPLGALQREVLEGRLSQEDYSRALDAFEEDLRSDRQAPSCSGLVEVMLKPDRPEACWLAWTLSTNWDDEEAAWVEYPKRGIHATAESLALHLQNKYLSLVGDWHEEERTEDVPWYIREDEHEWQEYLARGKNEAVA
jgi:hypothetical protein